jgi:hypothetical protein
VFYRHEEVLAMTSRSVRLYALRSSLALVLAVALVLMGTVAAFGIPDEFGGASFAVPYAPYTAGPVVDEEPYAPYTAGPVVREEFRPYAPYTAGPVVPTDELPYAPYTAGPVVPEVPEQPDPFGHYPYR